MSDPDNTDVVKQNWSRFLELLQQALTDGQSEPLLKLMLTSDECEALATRLQIIEELLNDELSQRQLKEQLGVGIATITRGSHGLKATSNEFRQWLSQQLAAKSPAGDG